MLTSDGMRFDLEVANAAQEILAAAFWRSDLWPRVQHIEPHWFEEWTAQQVWKAVRDCYALNGFLEADSLARLLRDAHGEDVRPFADYLVAAANAWVHPEFLLHHVEVIERFGKRREVELWAATLLRLCQERRPVATLREVFRDAPSLLKEAA